jgi:small subunit ribosomal protein S17
MKSKEKNIGLDVKAPEKECHDRNCPFHGTIKTHGRIFTGLVISDKAQKTVKVEMPRVIYFRKYERYGKDRTVIHAHNPDCIDAQKGDIVKIMETRPISKIKNFVVVEKVGHKEDVREKDYAAIEKNKEETKKVDQNASS